MVCGGPASTTSHSHHNRDGCVLLRVGEQSVIHAQEEVGAANTADAVEQKTLRDSQRVACPSVGIRVRDCMVAEDAVTSFGHKNLAARSSNFY